MAQRNILYTGPILETEHGPIHPEPCIVPYGGIPSFPQPTNNHTILPPSGNRTSFNPQHLPENHGPLPPGITQFNGLDHLYHPANNLFMTPTGARVFPVATNHGMQDQSPFFSVRGSFENCQFVDGFKRKNAEGFPGNVQYFNPTVGSSSSAGIPMNTEGAMIPGNYGGQPIQAVPNPWLDQQFCGNGNDGGAFSWNHGPALPYLQGPINGGGIEAANVGLHGYQVTPSNRNPAAFMHPTAITPHQGPHNLHHPPPMPPMQGPNIDFHPQLASTSRRLPTSTTVNPFQNGIDPGPRFAGPTPATGLRFFRPHRRELMVEATARQRAFPHLRVLPEDELLALGEQIGSAGSGLTDDFILEHLKTRVFATSVSSSEPEDPSSDDQELNSCVICQTNYDDQEQIGVLDCGHEYHAECVKKWLAVKNTCPVCKSTALAAKAKKS
ncbi:hypothetical protein M8C21_012613 [Ambrosia artemisiifolia]|uniref:RING-type E3 ubiquitin transferase n=1 Tax=Ambrosia artemisiifolia TaxID=4212 RepID=A0AAD5BSF8_AMBAR|nr:hypothetical protein M8C21_012613 [Ambrosia artemisiifolia]